MTTQDQHSDDRVHGAQGHQHVAPHDHPGEVEMPTGKKARKEIWKAFWILLGLTVAEFAIALGMPHDMREAIGGKTTITIIFLLLTVAKAYYIVVYFMHMKHERVTLIYTIFVPMILILYLLALLFYESANFIQL